MKRLTIYTILAILFLLIWSACAQNLPESPTEDETKTPIVVPPSTPSPSPTVPDTGVDVDHDNISDHIEEELVQRFAPIIILHPDDNYRPANILWYLPRVRMRFNVKGRLDDQILKQGEVNTLTLITQSNRDQFSGLTAAPTDFFLEHTDKGGGDHLDDYRSQTRNGTSSSCWVCYTHVRPAPAEQYQGMYDVQYIFFYAYNGDMVWGTIESAHEADFEHITVRVEDDLKTIHRIYYSAHDVEGRWYARETSPGAKDGYGVTEEGRPLVYSALDSHASYPWPGEWDRIRMPNDFTRDGGPEWDCKTNIINLGEKLFPMEDVNWLQYSGHWGEIGEARWTTGPYGPAYQSWWDVDPQEGD
jgi:hypothetical protein